MFGCFYLAAVWLSRNAKRKVLVSHAFKAASRLFGIPAFCYYAVADGSSPSPPAKSRSTPEAPNQPLTPQLPLFDT